MKNLKRLLKTGFSISLSLIGKYLPVNKELFVFNSLPDIADNAYGMYLELSKRDNVELVWIVEDKNNVNWDDLNKKNTIVVSKKTFKAIWLFLRARLVVVTHSIYCSYENLKKDRIILNTGHGMPLKRIGLMDDGKSWVPNLDYTISSSPLFQDIMAKCYGLPLDKVLVTGSPKCDLLFKETNFYQNHGIDKSSYNMVGIWMPTFRATNKVFDRVDGNFDDSKISFLRIDEMEYFNSFLKQENILLIIKLHPMDVLQNKDFRQFSNLLILKQNDMKEQLYPLLGSTDFLLTDYSSVWIDYNMLGKPIGFVVDDLNEYSKDRGFTTSVENVFPGKIISNIEALEGFLKKPERINKDIYNTYKDGNSAKRVLEALNI